MRHMVYSPRFRNSRQVDLPRVLGQDGLDSGWPGEEGSFGLQRARFSRQGSADYANKLLAMMRNIRGHAIEHDV